MLAESAITFRKASKAAAAEEEEEEEVEENPVTADPLLFICAPVQRTESRSVRGQAGFFITMVGWAVELPEFPNSRHCSISKSMAWPDIGAYYTTSVVI